MDRDRLKEVHKTDTTESRVNEDFVDWLKNKGPMWLLFVLIVMTAYLGSIRWRESRINQRIHAWQELTSAEESQALPATFEDVAAQFDKIDAVGVLGHLHSAQRLLQAVQTNQPLATALPGDNGEDVEETLSEEDREQLLSRADSQFQAVLEKDDGSFGMTLHAVNALNGRAAVAEARGDLDAAAALYNDAAARAESDYSHLAEQARNRAESASGLALDLTLPTNEEIHVPRESDEEGRPAIVEPVLQDLLQPSS